MQFYDIPSAITHNLINFNFKLFSFKLCTLLILRRGGHFACEDQCSRVLNNS